MSSTEKRVVELQFNNKQFEKNVSKSMSTIDKLDKKLSLDGVTDSVKTVTKSFKKMDMVVFTIIQRLTNKIIDLGVQLVKSLSVDNIFSGWIKYGEKTVSVATMFSQEIKIAGKTITEAAEKLEAINEQLDKLNWFTDETSYNFTDMVDNISKFTAAGVDLDQAVEAMMGIANWAALSGQNATTASRAMYQLAQSLGKGYVQLIDYKSIQNANMDTQEFRQTVLDTAVALKELTKEGDKYITKTGKSFTKNQFTEELSEKWFTSDVLTKSLEKYSAAVDDIYEIALETGLTASEVIARYGDELDQFGVKAFKAAQEARTLSDAMNSVKDAVSTGWMTTAEKIFGSYTESKELWTDLANELYDVFAAGGNFRNSVLSIWKDLEGRSDLFKHGSTDQGAFWNMYDAIVAIKKQIKSAWRSLFPLSEFESENDQAKDLANKLKDITKKFKEWSARLKQSVTEGGKLYNVMRAVFSVAKVAVLTLQGMLYIVNPVWTAIKQMFSYLTTRLSLVGKNLNKLEPVFTSIQSVVEKLHDSIENIVVAIDPVGFLDKMFVGLSGIMNVVRDYHPIEKLSNFLRSFIDSLKENGTNAENFKRIWKGVTSILSASLKLVKAIVSLLSKLLLPVLEALVFVVSRIVSVVSGLVTHLVAIIADCFTFIGNLVDKNFKNSGEEMTKFSNSVVNGLKQMKPLLTGLTSILKGFVDLVLAIPRGLNNISKQLTGNGIIDNLKKLGDTIGNAFNKIGTAMSKLFNNSSSTNTGALNASKNQNNIFRAMTTNMLGVNSLTEATKETNKVSSFLDALKELLDGLVSVINGIISILSTMVKALGKLLKSIGNVLQNIADSFAKFFESMKFDDLGQVLGLVVAVGLIAAVTVMIYNLFFGIKSLLAPVQYVAESLADLADGLRRYLTFQGLSAMINSISRILLSFSASLVLLVYAAGNPNFKTAVTTLGIFAGIIMGFTVVLMILAKALSGTSTVTKKLGKTAKGWNRSSTKTSAQLGMSLLYISRILSILTTGMIKIAIALRFMKDISSDQLTRASIVLGIFLVVISGIMIAITAFSRKTSSFNVDTKSLAKTTSSIIKFAIGLRLLCNSIVSLGKMDSDRMWQGIAGMSIVLLAFSAFVFLMQNKWTNLANANPNYSGFGKALFKFAMSILIITLSLKILNSISSEQLSKYALGLLALISIFSVLVIALTTILRTTKTFGKISKSLSSSAASVAETALKIAAIGISFALMASSLLIVVASIALLSTINWNKALPGLFVIIGFLAAFTGIIIALNKTTKVLQKNQHTAYANLLALSVDMVAMTSSLLILTAVIALLSTINWNKAWPGLIVIGVFLAAMSALILTIATKAKYASKGATSSSGALLALAGVLAAFAATMLVITADIALLSTINWSKAWPGLILVGVFLGALVTSLALLTKKSKSAILSSKEATRNLIALSATLGALSLTLTVIAASLMIFSNTSLEGIGKMAAGVGLFVVVIASLVAALAVLKNAGVDPIYMISFATALTIMSAALIVFAVGIGMLSTIPWMSIAKGLLIVLSAIAVLALSALLLKPITPIILALAVSLFLIAAAFMLAAAAMGAMAEALGPFMEAFNSNFDMIAETIGNVASLLVVGLIDGFETLLDKTSELLPKIADFIIDLVENILRIINELAPQIVETLINLLKLILEFLVESADEIFDNVLKLILSLLKMVKKYLPELISDICDIILLVIQGLTKYLPQFIAAIFEFLTKMVDLIFGPSGQAFFLHVISTIVSFIGNILSYLVNYIIQFAGLVAKLILILIAASLQIALTLLGTLASYLISFFGGLIWLCVEVIRGLSNVIYTAIKNIFVLIVETIGTVLTEIFPLLVAAGRYFILSLAEGMLQAIENSFIGTLLKFFGVSFDGAHNALNSARQDMLNTMNGIAGDMGEAIKTAGTKIMGTVGTIVTTMQDITADGLSLISSTVDGSAEQIASAMGDFGKNLSLNLAEGIAQGAEESAEVAAAGGTILADATIEGFKEECEINSPSRVMMKMGGYMAEGLAEGIEENVSEPANAMADLAEQTLDVVGEMLDEGVGDNTLTIRPVLDTESVKEGVSDITDLMTSINGNSVGTNLGTTVSSEIARANAENAKAASQNQNGASSVTNEGDTYNCTFNVTTNDPEEFVDEVDRLLQKRKLQLKFAKGG